MIYFECFYNTNNDPIVEKGYVYQGEISVNMSSIYTKLIQEAGRFCDRYASDILYDIQSINRYLESQESITEYIAFRECGVDNTAYISCKPPQELLTYRAIYAIKIEFTEDDYYTSKVTVTLNKVRYSITDHELMWRIREEKN